MKKKCIYANLVITEFMTKITLDEFSWNSLLKPLLKGWLS